MSLVNVLLQQRVIPMMIGFAVLLLMVAITLIVLGRLRKKRAKRARLQALALKRQQLAEAAAEAAAPVLAEQVAVATSVTPKVEPPKEAPKAEEKKLEIKLDATVEEKADKDSAISDLLAGVFDEEAAARYAVLLADTEPTDMASLAALAHRIAGGLRAQFTA